MNTLFIDDSSMSEKNKNVLQGYASINKLKYSNVYRKVVIPPFVGQMPITELSVANKYMCSYKVELWNAVSLRLKDLTIQNFVVARPQLIASFSQLSSLTLVGARITNFDFIQHLTLKELKIQLASFSFEEKRIIAAQTGLQKLALNKCNFREVHLLQNIQLRELSLSGNKLKNSDFVDCRFKHLQSLDVSFNLLRSLDHLVDLSPQLVGINASMNKIGKLFYNEEQAESGIEELDISYNKLFDIQGLQILSKLESLDIHRNKTLCERRMQIINILPLKKLNISHTLCTTVNFVNPISIQSLVYENSQYCKNISRLFTWPNLKNANLLHLNYLQTYQELYFKHYSKQNTVQVDYPLSIQDAYCKDVVPAMSIMDKYNYKMKILIEHMKLKNMFWFRYTLNQINFLLALHKMQSGQQQRTERNYLQYKTCSNKQQIQTYKLDVQKYYFIFESLKDLVQIKGKE
ncbi:leucine-rich_repeat domain-containing protein [Hexamita inflata]|uniref:Leucine-rich repeat domain-containing protein n=1 Tax=Hexamita inflata TaxID=28002 RepID=A0AA86QJ08_9EUKA|nr:leucine-rich repeat domain-containing protein [Hexamita inflata]